MKTYELIPTDGRKSFYGKAQVQIDDTGAETLYSYGTKIITRNANGSYTRHYDGWTATTGRHIKAFCGMNKAEFTALPAEARAAQDSGGRVLTNAESYAAMMFRRHENQLIHSKL